MSIPTSGSEMASPPPLPPAQPPTFVKLPKNPTLALVLSLFPGLGQVYNGQPAKAFVFFAAWVTGIYGAAEINPFPFAFIIPFAYLYNLVDAYRSAASINARYLGGGLVEEDESPESPAWGGSLVVLGIVLLAHNLGWINLAAVERYWPVFLIVGGVVMVYGSMKKRRGAETSGGSSL
jgi:TM2 domain-containing membrane protein YozV